MSDVVDAVVRLRLCSANAGQGSAGPPPHSSPFASKLETTPSRATLACVHPEGVEIKGFRSIELVQLSLDGLTVLFGRNGAGKTNLLEAVAGALAAERHSLRDQSGATDIAPSSVDLFLRTSLSLDEDRRWLLKVLRSRPEDVVPQDLLVTLGLTDLSRSEFGRQVDGSLVMLPESEDIAVVLESLALQLCAEFEDEDRELALRFTRALLVAPLVAVPVGSPSRIDLAARVGDPQLRTAAEAVCSKLPPHQWVTQSASRCLDGNGEFVTLFPLGWLRSDERTLPVDVLVLDAAPVGLEEEIEQAMPELFDRFWGVTEAADRVAAERLGWGSALADPWLERAGAGVQLRGAILPILNLVERYAWANAPEFVSQHEGGISVQARPVEEWYGTGRRIRVGFRFGHSESDLFPVSALGAGLQRWVAASVREALRQVGNAQIRVWSVGQLDEAAEEPDKRLHRLGELLDESLSLSEFQRLEYEGEIAPAPGLLLVDEPELHLHPKAQEDVARWLYDRSQQSRAVLVATHSASFLCYEHATVVRVYREADRTVTDVLGQDLLAALGDLDADVGLGRAGILQVLRGVLAVEGMHDELVIKHFFRADLAEQRLLVIPIHGAPNALSVAEGELFTRLGVPIRVILDQGDRERKLARLVDQRSTPGADVQEIIYDEPDVVCALPEAAVRRAFPSARFPGWDQLKRDHGGKFGFKGLALESMGLKGTKPTDFVTQVLRVVEPEERPSPAFQRVVRQAFSSIN